MKWRSLFLAGVAAMVPTVALANCGSIPFVAEATVYRPTQRAVTAFDGREQILLLSTDLRADRPTNVLEVLPFPSEPKVEVADDELFQRARQLIEDRLTEQPASVMAAVRGGPGGHDAEFHERIDVGNSVVVRLTDSRSFVAWVTDHLRAAGVDDPSVSTRVKFLARDYARDGFTWFVFNVIELGPEMVARQSVRYRFATPRFYYPLRIMGTDSGATTIRLVLVSPRLVQMPDLRPGRAVLLHQPLPVGASDLKYLDAGLAAFLEDEPQQLRLWEIKGALGTMRRDVWADWF
ncbi:MAG: DUF2330 domain-containing protein [Patescibacteria group bacterium]|nr:DUF2330 domain-containing protein [Patescibacteria group bacterium]